MSETTTPSAPRLRRSGIVLLIGTFLGAPIEGLLLLAAAGTIDLPRAWLFVAVSFVAMFGQITLVAIRNPELVNHRGRWKKKKDTKPWDKPLVSIFGLLAFYVTPIVMGLDLGRYYWTAPGPWSTVLGIALFALGTIILTWAMLVNTHFETTVRIQRDRAHRVVTKGPYRIVRHPGYVGAALWSIAGPLTGGSLVALVPAALAVLILVIRTSLEDQTLQRELPGYADYTQQVPHRLLPGLW